MKQEHELYTNEDFTQEEYEQGNRLAVYVIDGGLGICKKCGAGEVQLEQYPTCTDYKARPKDTI
jgi:hypothetical protein